MLVAGAWLRGSANMLEPGGIEMLSLLPTYLLPPWQYCDLLSGFLVVNHGTHTA